MRFLAVLVLFAGCDWAYQLSRDDGVQRTLLITQGTDERLEDFPVSIVLDDANLDEVAREDGRDIQFESEDGRALPFELVRYDDGELEAWVRVTLERRTTIHMTYGSDTMAIADPTETWSDRFQSVWHLDGDEREERDSTQADNDLTTPVNQPPPATAPGLTGNARKFSDASADPDKSALCAAPARLLQPLASFSLSMWVNLGSAVSDRWSQPFEAGGFNELNPGIAIELDGNLGSLNAIFTAGGMHTELSMTSPTYGAWTYLTVVVDVSGTTEVRLYVNAAQTMLEHYSWTSIASLRPTCLGGGNGYEGLLDEARIYEGALTDAWIKAEYDNVNARETFVQLVD